MIRLYLIALWVLFSGVSVALASSPSQPRQKTQETGMTITAHSIIKDGALQAVLPASGAVHIMAFATRPGDYVRGTIDTGNIAIDLELLDDNGMTLRRLLGQSTGKGEFQFVAPEGEVSLQLTRAEADFTPYTITENRPETAFDSADNAKGFDLQISMHVPVNQQIAPAAGYQSQLISQAARVVANGGNTDGFWRHVAQTGTPLIEAGLTPPGFVLVTFVYRGAQHNVRLFGAPSGNHEYLDRLEQSDIWFKSFVVPTSTRMSYQLAPDVPDVPGSARDQRVAILATAQQDPLNRFPQPVDGPDLFNRQSTMVLSDAPLQPGMAAPDGPVTPGQLVHYRRDSAILGNQRDVYIYTPAGFNPQNPKNVLLFVFDARAYLTKIPTPDILDNLMAEGKIPPVMAVFISNPDADARARELPANPDFADAMATEFLPWVISETGIKAVAARTVLAGSSYGGLAAATIALRHPDAFGNALSMSGSFWWHPRNSAASADEFVARHIVNQPVVPVRFFLSAGLFETGHSGVGGIIDTNRHLRDVLEAKNYDVHYREFAGGHDYLVWRGALADGLIDLFGAEQAK
ncbi:alpha/beta hydrolase-fold protein [Thalassospira sp.]|uniref:alpha/beta hydrolase-fold protein n=1 Tax=Thalassospira sp. TaxID=1912094 RepID=UPI003AA83BDF